MAVTIVVEDGTGLTNSTSYVSIADFKAYWTQRGVDYTSETDDTISLWVNEATRYADSYYCYCGTVYSVDQALEVPRINWYDNRGNNLAETVPTQLVSAVCEIAHAMQGTITTTDTTGIKSKSVGPLSVAYGSPSRGETTEYTRANNLMVGLLCSNGMTALPK